MKTIDISKKIHELLRIRNITKGKLAKELGITEQGLYKMLKTNDCKVSTLEKIAKYLNAPIAYFFDEYIVDTQIIFNKTNNNE